MKKIFKSVFILVLFGLFGSSQAIAQQEYIVCNSKFKVYCDGTVDVDLASDVYRYKVFIGGTELFDFQGSAVITTPFNTGDFMTPSGDKVVVTPALNFWVQIYRPGCVDNFPISFYMSQTCPPPTQVECGSTFDARCNGTFDVDLADNVFRYKVFNHGTEILDLQGSQVLLTPFNTGDFTTPSGDPVVIRPEVDNFWVEIYAPGCLEIVNLSDELYTYCSDYNPCYGLTGDRGNDYTYGVSGSGSGSSGSATWEAPSNLSPSFTEIKAYPNPTSTDINVSLPVLDSPYSVELFDISGKMVNSLQTTGGDVVLEVDQLRTGLYLLKVQNGSLNYLEKIQVLR